MDVGQGSPIWEGGGALYWCIGRWDSFLPQGSLIKDERAVTIRVGFLEPNTTAFVAGCVAAAEIKHDVGVRLMAVNGCS